MTDTAGRIFAAALRDDVDHEAVDKLAEIHIQVTKYLVCPISGKVLDSRTAHLITARAKGLALTATGVIHPDVSDSELAHQFDTYQLDLLERFDPASIWAVIR